MAPLLKNVFGNNPKDRDPADAMRALLETMQREHARGEALVKQMNAAADRLQTLGEPVAQAGASVDDVNARLADVQQRLAGVAQLLPQLERMDERLGGLTEGQQRAEAAVVQALGEAQRITASFEGIDARIQQAANLSGQMERFLELERPFQQARDDVASLRGQVTTTGDALAKLREQHDRLLDAHRLAASKLEALERRREDLSRDLQDKERRVAGVAQAVRGLDGIQSGVDDLRRQITTLKALGDFLASKTSALEAQRETVENAIARADGLEAALRQLDAGVRAQRENATTLSALQDDVSRLQTLHDAVLERSREIDRQQQQTDESTRSMRSELAAAHDEMKKSVERFDFESRGLESVSQRVSDARAALSDFEARLNGLSAASQSVAVLVSQTQSLSTRVQALSGSVAGIDAQAARLPELQRELDALARVARDAGDQVARIEAAKPEIAAALEHVEQLRGANAQVRDALEQAHTAHDAITRQYEAHAHTQEWLERVDAAVAALRTQADALQHLQPLVDRAEAQAQRVVASLDTVQERQAFVESLHQRLTALGTLGGDLDERGRDLLARMSAAEARFAGLSEQSEDAERTARRVAETAAELLAARREAEDVVRSVTAARQRCESVEALAARTETLKHELDQRHAALANAREELKAASTLRQESAQAAKQLGDLAKKLVASVKAAEERAGTLDELSARLERRTDGLGPVEQRLDGFDERMAKWNLVEQDLARALEQLAGRQGTVDALHADLERMFAMTEKTANEVRGITSARREVEDGHRLLGQVVARLREVRELADTLDEREHQMGQAEERLARADALLVDVRSSLDALQGHKVVVDQAVEKAGSLQVLVKQAEAMAAGLREEREMLGRVRSAVGADRDDADAEDEDDDEEPMAKAA